MKRSKFILVIIFCLAIFVRFYNYENRITFGPEQAISLITSGRIVTDKFSLLGNQNLLRKTSSGHSLFAGALFSYTLIPLQIVFNYDPLFITIYFTLLNIFTGLVMYIIVQKMFDKKTAIISTVLFLFWDVSIYHSLFIWNQNYSFLLGIISIYLLYLIKNKPKSIYSLILGFLIGFAYSIQDLYALAGLIVFFILTFITSERRKYLSLYLIGALLANLPAVIFDLRHDFYHIRTNLSFFVDTIAGKNTDASFSYYHFLIYSPILIILLALLLNNLCKRSYLIVGVFLVVFICFNMTSRRINFQTPAGMPAELTLRNIYKAADIIAEDKPSNYNVAVLVDFDTRGHILRYPLEFKYNIRPMGILDYPVSSNLYVLANESYDFENSKVWELSSFIGSDSNKIANVSENYAVYKFAK